MTTISIDPAFASTMFELHGERGSAWIKELPALIEACETRWSLTVFPHFEPLSYNFVAPAVGKDGTQVVVKAGVPNPELLTEIEALRHYRGDGIVRLLDSDPKKGILLLERLSPGMPLSRLENDDQATFIAGEVMCQLWKAPPETHSFPTVARWGKGFQRLRKFFDGGSGPIPTKLLQAAETQFAELLVSSSEPVLLHGDLHHENILSARRAPWLALDPKGVIGEPAYEVGALLRNPIPGLLEATDPTRIVRRRIDLLAEKLGFERQRLVAWGMAQAVLSAWWSIEDHGLEPGREGWEWSLACAEIMGAIERNP